MQQTKLRERLVEVGLLSTLVLLGTFGVLGVTAPKTDRGVAGVMPETVCTADRASFIVEEIVIRASRPSAGAFAQLSGIKE